MFPFDKRDHDRLSLRDETSRARTGRRRARPPEWVSLLVLFLVTSVLAAGFPPYGGVARADPVPPGLTPPADLLNFTLLSTANQPFFATTAQQQSLKNFEQSAVSNLLADHGLPSGETATGQTWGRTDALAELWALIDQAISLPATCTAGQTPGRDCRSSDQQNVVDWFTNVYRLRKVQEADAAGLEYVKWEGYDQNAYETLLASNPSESALSNFFCNGTVGHLCLGPPLNYSGVVYSCPADTDADVSGQPETDTDTPCRQFQGVNFTSGYCVYQPPVPYESEYSDGGRTDCNTPSTGFYPAGPTYDQLVKWGAADVNFSELNDPGLLQTLHGVSIGVGLAGAVAAGAAVGTVLAGSSPFGSLALVTSFQRAVLPFASRAFLSTAAVTDGVSEAASATGNTAEAAGQAASETAEIGGAAGVAGILALAASILIAIAVSIEAGIIIGNSNEVPFQLASLIANAPTANYDLKNVLADSSQAPNLFTTFVEAALPAPLYGTCVPLVVGGSLQQCLNAPAIPDADYNNADPIHDPIFAIQQSGSTATSYSTSLTWTDQQTDVDDDGDTGTDTDNDAAQDSGPAVTKMARVHENWLIQNVSDLPGVTVQTLRLHYTDWNGVGQNAWIFNDPTNGYRFLSIPDLAAGTPLTPTTCMTDHTCTYSSTIQYVGADGNKYSARLISQAPQSTISVSPNYFVTEGTPVTFTVNGASASNTYAWSFQQPETCPDYATSDAQCTNPFTYTTPVSGASATYTWPENGHFRAQLTTTFPGGASSTTDLTVFTVPVTPQLTLSPAAPSTDPTCASTSPCDVHEIQVGNTVTLTGSVTHGASGDNELVTVDWGDEAPGSGDEVKFSSLRPGTSMSMTRTSDTEYNFTATHTYANPGKYSATVQASQEDYNCDTCGPVTVSTTTPETIWALPTLAWSSPASISYGTPLSDTQLNATATYNGSSVPGTFAYYDYFGNFGLSASRVAAGQVLQAGQHPLLAYFIPADPSVYHQAFFGVGARVTLSVTPVPLTLTENDRIAVQGDSEPDLTPSVTGLVNHDTLSSIGVTCRANDRKGNPVSQSTPVGADLITCTGSPSNYNTTVNPGTLFITQNPVKLTDSDTSTSGSAVLGSGGSGTPGSLAATGTGGSGTLALGKYGGNPGPTDPYNTTNAYFDAFLAPGGTDTSVQVIDCNLNGGNLVYWFDGTSWKIPSKQNYDAATGCVTVTVTGTSVPALGQLGDGFFGVLQDSTPPTTTAQGKVGTGSAAYAPGSWTNQPVQVTLSAKDNAGGSGVNASYYKLDGGPATQYAPGSNITVSGEGKHTLTYWSTDFAGNAEDQTVPGNTIAIDIDTTQPVVSYTGNAGTYTVDQSVAIVCSGSDPVHGGVSSGIASTTCQNLNDPAYDFNLGTDSYSASATDRAGNVGSGSTSFVVKVTFDTLCNATKEIVPAAGHPASMCTLLQQAAKDAAHNSAAKVVALNAYRHLVQAQVGKTITQANATILENLSKAL